jgi:hypothetical protein
MVAIRVKKQKVSRRGQRGLIVSINPTLVADLGVTAGEYLSAYRGMVNGKQVIILANCDDPILSDERDK